MDPSSSFHVSFSTTAITVVAAFIAASQISAEASTYASAVTEVAALPVVRPDFPRPTDQNLLFYIQHSSSANTVVYTARVDPNGQIDHDQPIEVYWRHFADDGGRASLSFIERIFGYGVHVEPQAKNANAVTAYIVGYPQRAIRVDIGSDGKPRASIDMANHQAKLIYVYLDVDEQHLIPSILRADIFGLDLENSQVLYETLTPSPIPKN
jgi:hypothetical protein